VDIGHFVAGNNASPVDFIKRHHARITHVHVKDRTKNNGGNTPFGQGDTPIVEVLRLIRDNRWTSRPPSNSSTRCRLIQIG
jgi:sugar phosphate isomerase/epimerase